MYSQIRVGKMNKYILKRGSIVAYSLPADALRGHRLVKTKTLYKNVSDFYYNYIKVFHVYMPRI